MINRDLIRTKVVQLTYAYYVNGSGDQTNAEKELLFSLSQAYELYLLLLQFIVALRNEAENQWSLNDNRLNREGGINQTRRNFIDNKFALQLKDCEQLQELTERNKGIWEENVGTIRKVLQLIEQSECYENYMKIPAPTYEDDREFWKQVYKTIIIPNDDINEVLEESSLYWNDDRFVVDTFIIKTIRRFEESNGAKQQLLEEYRSTEDRSFAINLFRNTIDNCEEYRGYMAEVSKNWDVERFSMMDIVLLQMAIAELLNFPDIAVHVTINEYIELAKIYSTPKSSGYVNGMLDAIARMLNEKGLMLKPVKKQ